MKNAAIVIIAISAVVFVWYQFLMVPAQERTVLINATVIDGTGGPAIENATIVIEGGRITCIGASECDTQTGTITIIDVAGKFLTPGLVDAHVHFSQTGWLSGRPDGLELNPVYPYPEVVADLQRNPERWMRSYMCTGITAVYDVGGQPFILELPDRFENDANATHVRAAGPLITHATGRAMRMNVIEGSPTFLPMGGDDEGRESVRWLVERGSNAIKVWYLRPPEGQEAEYDARLMAVGAEANTNNVPLIVHATSLREAKVALRAGATLLVHSVGDQNIDDEFISLALANNAIYSPTILVGANWTRAMASVALGEVVSIDDPNGCVDPALQEDIAEVQRLAPYMREGFTAEAASNALAGIEGRIEQLSRNLMLAHEAGITIATSTDAGNPLTLHGPSIYNEMEVMQAAGLSPHDIIVMSTRNGALAMDRLFDFGTLEVGKIADLVVLEEDPRTDISNYRTITHVMRMGVLHAIDDLNYD